MSGSWKLVFVLLLLAFLPETSQAQTRQIQGITVDDSSGLGLANVNLRITKQSIGATSNEEGLFTISIPDSIRYLMVSHVGYKDLKIKLPDVSPKHPFVVRLTKETIDLQVVTIEAYATQLRPMEVDGAVQKIDQRDLLRIDGSSIQPALNLIPGVRMESRGLGGSRRLSIRGSLLRSPFGVRNIKTYWNGLPLTLTDGATPLEMTDPALLNSLTIMRGPAGSTYGPGYGGVILLNSSPHDQELMKVGTQFGSFGQNLQNAELNLSLSPKASIRINYLRSQTDGYRQQEANHKDQLHISGEFNSTRDLSLSWLLFYYDGFWELPGSIDETDRDTNPRMALPYSETANAHVYRNWLGSGLKLTKLWRDNLKGEWSALAYRTQKINPFGTSPFFNGYKSEKGYGGASRLSLTYTPTAFTEIIAGGETDLQANDFPQYDNVEGMRGALRTNFLFSGWQYFSFLKITQKLPLDFVVTAGASHHLLYYYQDFDDRFLSSDSDNKKRYQAQFSPRVSIRKTISEQLSGFLSWSRGFSPPTLWEDLGDNNQLSTRLQAEKASSWEAGVHSSLWRSRINLDLNIFYQSITDLILPKEDNQGRTFYENTGQVEQMGLEIFTAINLIKNPQLFFQQINLLSGLAINNYRFGAVTSETESLENNHLTGVPLRTFSIGALVQTRGGFEAQVTFQETSKIPLNDANTVYSEAYSLLALNLGKNWIVGKRFKIRTYGGVGNILDEHYTSFHQLNAFGGRYYNPAPGRHYFFGVSVQRYLN